MIYVFCGVSWPATYAVTALFKSHLDQSGRSAAICDVGGLDDIGRLALQHSEEVLLLATRWMSFDLINALTLSNGVPIIYVETPSSALFSHWLEHTDNDPMAALRETTRDLAPLVDMLARVEKVGNLKVFSTNMTTDEEAITTFVLEVLRDAPRSISLEAPGDPNDIAWPDPSIFASQHIENKEVADMLFALDANMSARSGQYIQLPIHLLSQPGGDTLDRPIDLTGSPRGLFWGPLIHLQLGAWTVTASFLCNDITQRPKLAFDAAHFIKGEHSVLSRSEFNLISNGRIKVSFTFVNSTPLHPLEFRLNLTQGVFHGTLTLEEMSLHPSSESLGDI